MSSLWPAFSSHPACLSTCRNTCPGVTVLFLYAKAGCICEIDDTGQILPLIPEDLQRLSHTPQFRDFSSLLNSSVIAAAFTWAGSLEWGCAIGLEWVDSLHSLRTQGASFPCPRDEVLIFNGEKTPFLPPFLSWRWQNVQALARVHGPGCHTELFEYWELLVTLKCRVGPLPLPRAIWPY